MIKKYTVNFKRYISTLFRQEVLYYFFLVALMIPNVLLAVTESSTMIEKICSLVLPLGLYFIVATISKRVGLSTTLPSKRRWNKATRTRTAEKHIP